MAPAAGLCNSSAQPQRAPLPTGYSQPMTESGCDAKTGPSLALKKIIYIYIQIKHMYIYTYIHIYTYIYMYI